MSLNFLTKKKEKKKTVYFGLVEKNSYILKLCQTFMMGGLCDNINGFFTM